MRALDGVSLRFYMDGAAMSGTGAALDAYARLRPTAEAVVESVRSLASRSMGATNANIAAVILDALVDLGMVEIQRVLTGPSPDECAPDATFQLDLQLGRSFMILCPSCGNKRCPKATDDTLNCTGSNEPGQPGSAYA